jgi:hypothetical protein
MGANSVTADEVAQLEVAQKAAAQREATLQNRYATRDWRSREIPVARRAATDDAARRVFAGGELDSKVIAQVEQLDRELTQLRIELPILARAIELAVSARTLADAAVQEARRATSWHPIPRPKVIRIL